MRVCVCVCVGGYEGLYEFESAQGFYNRVWKKLGLNDVKARGRYKEKLSDCTYVPASMIRPPFGARAFAPALHIPL